MIHRLSPGFLGALLVFVLAIAPTPMRADELTNYFLDTQDKVKVDVIEWLSGEGKYQNWESVSGEYTVSVAGNQFKLPISNLSRGESNFPGEIMGRIKPILATFHLVQKILIIISRLGVNRLPIIRGK